LDRAGWGLVLHQQRHNMLLLITSRHTTLSTLIFYLIHSQKANSYLFLSFTGMANVGNYGSDGFIEYSAIGLNTNLASR